MADPNPTRTLISTGSTFERRAGYSRAVVSGEWCFVSGTTGYDYDTMTLAKGAAAQARQGLATIRSAVEEAGFSMEDTVRARYVVSRREDVEAVFEAVGEIFATIRPAATMTIGELIEPDMLVEIDVTLHRPG